MRVIGIDAIYIPQNWKLSTHHGDQNCHIVPHEASECTLELNFLYDNIVNAMAQKLINVLGLYRMQMRRKNDLMIPRILFGAGKKNKRSKSIKAIGNSDMAERFDPIDLVESKDNFDHKHFELYYRLYLLCQYYFKYFEDQKKRADKQDDKETVLLYIRPTTNAPEGSLLKMLFTIFNETVSKNAAINETKMNLSQLKEYITHVDRIIEYHSLKDTNIQKVYDYIVEYVNKNYGIINVSDYEKIGKLDEHRKDFMNQSNNQYKVQRVLDQLSGANSDEAQEFQGLLQFKTEQIDIESNNSYLNI